MTFSDGMRRNDFISTESDSFTYCSGDKKDHFRERSSGSLQNVRHIPAFATNGSDTFLSRYYAGCSTFLPVFDSGFDTFESLHERSPFAFDCICYVAAKVRDGGGRRSFSMLWNSL